MALHEPYMLNRVICLNVFHLLGSMDNNLFEIFINVNILLTLKSYLGSAQHILAGKYIDRVLPAFKLIGEAGNFLSSSKGGVTKNAKLS